MIDYARFADEILSIIGNDEISDLLNVLDKITMLKFEKPHLLSSLNNEELLNLLTLINQDFDKLNNIIVEFHKISNIKNIDRLSSAFRRMLNQKGFEIIEIELATDTINRSSIQKMLGKEAIYIYKRNPSLIAGINIKSAKDEYAFNLNQYLTDLEAALIS